MPREAAKTSVQELCQFFESVRKETRQKSFSSDNLTTVGSSASDERPPLVRRQSFSSSDVRVKFINNFQAFEGRKEAPKVTSLQAPADGAACSADPSDVADLVSRVSGCVSLHEPVIRTAGKANDGLKSCGKNPLLRMFSNHCGLENKLKIDRVRNSARPERSGCRRHRKVSQSASAPLDAMSEGSRLSWFSPAAEDHSPLRPSVVSTASISLSRRCPTLARERLSSESERTISVIQTAKASPLLDKWLCSLVKQPGDTGGEEADCGEVEVFQRHHYATQQPWSSLAMRGRQPPDREFDRRSSADSGRHSEAKSVEQASDAGVSIHVTEDDADSVCLQSVSDAASVQLCVPGWEERDGAAPRQHLPLSPCSSVGSVSSFRSSNADSAVDLEDDTLEIEVYTYRNQAGRASHSVHYRQAMFARSKPSSSSSSSSGRTVVEPSASTVVASLRGQACSSSGGVSLLQTTWRLGSAVPSLVISDHSTCGQSLLQGEDGVASLDSGTVVPDTLQLCGPLHRTPSSSSVTSVSTEDSFCSSCWTDSSASDDDLPSARRRRVSFVSLHFTVSARSSTARPDLHASKLSLCNSLKPVSRS